MCTHKKVYEKNCAHIRFEGLPHLCPCSVGLNLDIPFNRTVEHFDIMKRSYRKDWYVLKSLLHKRMRINNIIYYQTSKNNISRHWHFKVIGILKVHLCVFLTDFVVDPRSNLFRPSSSNGLNILQSHNFFWTGLYHNLPTIYIHTVLPPYSLLYKW